MMDNEVWRWVWTGLALLMGLGEIVTAGFFLLPFAIGAGLAAIAAWTGVSDIVQWLLFFVGTGLSFLYVRRFMRAQDEDGGLVVGPGRYVGMEALGAADDRHRRQHRADQGRGGGVAGRHRRWAH